MKKLIDIWKTSIAKLTIIEFLIGVITFPQLIIYMLFTTLREPGWSKRSRRLIATMERIWVEENKKLNLINYIYYRYFTKDFLVFLLETKYKDENKR